MRGSRNADADEELSPWLFAPCIAQGEAVGGGGRIQVEGWAANSWQIRCLLCLSCPRSFTQPIYFKFVPHMHRPKTQLEPFYRLSRLPFAWRSWRSQLADPRPPGTVAACSPLRCTRRSKLASQVRISRSVAAAKPPVCSTLLPSGSRPEPGQVSYSTSPFYTNPL